MESIARELRYAGRRLLRRPLSSLATVATLSLGIGVVTAILSVAYAVFVRPLAFREPERVLQLERHLPGTGHLPNTSVPQYQFWREHSETFASVSAYDWLPVGYNLTGDDRPERIVGARATASFFPTFGVQPALGRGFSEAEDRPGGPLVVVLSHRLWQRRFAADPGIVGRDIELNGQAHSVIGIFPARFRYPAHADLWVPLQADPASRDRQAYLRVSGRLAPGVSRAQAQAEMDGIEERFKQQYWSLSDEERIGLRPVQEALLGDLRAPLLMLTGAAAFVLLIGCANVTNLQLADAARRRRDLAIERSLGASRRRIVGSLVAESAWLGVAGGLAGWGVGLLLLPLLAATVPAQFAALVPVRPDGLLLLLSLAVAVAAILLSGSISAWRGGRMAVATRDTGGGGGRESTRLREGLLVAQIALAAISLAGAGLLARSFLVLRSTDPGFVTENVTTFKLPLPASEYREANRFDAISTLLLDRLRALPGVDAAGAVSTLPMTNAPGMSFVIEGQPPPESEEDVPWGNYRAVSGDYFAALGVELVGGRRFTPADSSTAPGVAIVNREVAQQFFAGRDPIGEQITIGPPVMPPLGDPAPRTIVGVVDNVRETGLDADLEPVLYVPFAQAPDPLRNRLVELYPLAVVLRTGPATGPPFETVRSAVSDFDSRLPIIEVETLERVLASTLGDRVTNLRLIGLFAGLALGLAAIGIYGVLAYLVQLRTREIGLRMAMGAAPARVRWYVFGRGLRGVAVGLGLGLLAAYGLGRYVESQLHGVSSRDPATYAIVAGVVLAVAALALYLPVRRASRIDPAAALRQT